MKPTMTKGATPGGSELLTTDEAARYLRRRPAALRLLVRKGLIGYYRPNGRGLLFRLSDVEAFLASVYRPVRAGRATSTKVEV